MVITEKGGLICMIYLLFGLFIALAGVAASFIFWDAGMVMTVTSSIGTFFLIMACILSGALVNGDRMRANLATESGEDRTNRNKMTLHSVLLGIPSLLIGLFCYFFF